MLGSAKMVGFVPTKSFRRSKAFFRDRLGLRLLSEDDFALVFDANGISLRVAQVEDLDPAPYTILGWEVADIEKTVSALRKKGVKFTRYSGMGQDKNGIWSSPSGARVAWFKDADGNTLSLTEL